MKKKLCLIFCIVSCILMMAGCSLSLTKTNKNFNKKTLETNADSFVSSWFSYDFESAVKSMKEQSTEVDEDAINQYKESVRHCRFRLFRQRYRCAAAAGRNVPEQDGHPAAGLLPHADGARPRLRPDCGGN